MIPSGYAVRILAWGAYPAELDPVLFEGKKDAVAASPAASKTSRRTGKYGREAEVSLMRSGSVQSSSQSEHAADLGAGADEAEGRMMQSLHQALSRSALTDKPLRNDESVWDDIKARRYSAYEDTLWQDKMEELDEWEADVERRETIKMLEQQEEEYQRLRARGPVPTMGAAKSPDSANMGRTSFRAAARTSISVSRLSVMAEAGGETRAQQVAELEATRIAVARDREHVVRVERLKELKAELREEKLQFAEENGALGGFKLPRAKKIPERRSAIHWPKRPNTGGFFVKGPRSHLSLIGLDLVAVGNRDRRLVTIGSFTPTRPNAKVVYYDSSGSELESSSSDNDDMFEGLEEPETREEYLARTEKKIRKKDRRDQRKKRTNTSEWLDGCTAKIYECRMFVRAKGGDHGIYPSFNTKGVF